MPTFGVVGRFWLTVFVFAFIQGGVFAVTGVLSAVLLFLTQLLVGGVFAVLDVFEAGLFLTQGGVLPGWVNQLKYISRWWLIWLTLVGKHLLFPHILLGHWDFINFVN